MLLKLSNALLMQLYDSDNCLYIDGKDSCIGYVVYYTSGSMKESGEFDYRLFDYTSDEKLFNEVIAFEFCSKEITYKVICNTPDVYYETLGELLEDLDKDTLELVRPYISNPFLLREYFK